MIASGLDGSEQVILRAGGFLTEGETIRAVREDPALDAAHPAVWAPFTLVGEGR